MNSGWLWNGVQKAGGHGMNAFRCLIFGPKALTAEIAEKNRRERWETRIYENRTVDRFTQHS